MPHLALSLPSDVQAKLAQYAAVYQCDPDAVVLCLRLETLARLFHQEAAEAVAYWVRHSKIRQFPEYLLDRSGYAFDAVVHRIDA